jgi:hypothetical protein
MEGLAMDIDTQADQLLTIEQLYESLTAIEEDGEVDSVRMYSSADHIVVRKGSSNVIVKFLNSRGEEHEIDEPFDDGTLIELWSMVATELKDLTQENRLEIFEFIGTRVYRVGAPSIDSEGTLTLESTLPAEDISSRYCARYITEFVSFVDRIDSDIAKRWNGLTWIDEGPDRDQGSANHAAY